ncbi:hypothetical protein OJF2_55080 [Aquisphaera giovannonii]|uniref:Uncharacterized protein n=1 Tax=Aquisphaera giovannonii TaxID=406548 RepID=A0A5B9W8T3_9BACT|nr:hypothetical protein [Aquisphaera giovannonii]QEH36923.1 hypothetical protein OJF2_55080 [Aquisphaera giovannonii]
MHPDVFSWIQVGEGNRLWGWTETLRPFHGRAFAIEHRLGLGVLTPLACALGLYLGRRMPLCRVAMVVIFLVWIFVTFLPGDVLSIAAMAACCYALAILFRNRAWPEMRYAAIGIIGSLYWLGWITSPDLRAVGLTALGLCFIELVRSRNTPGWRAADWIALAAMTLSLYPVAVWIYPLGMASPLAALALLRWPDRRKEIALAAAGSMLLLLVLLVELIIPEAILRAVLAVPMAIAAAAASPRGRPSGPRVFGVLAVAVPFLLFFYHQDSLWLSLSHRIPGAVGIRAIGRAVPILLYPAALGLGLLVDRLASSGRRAAAWLLAAACMAEQVVRNDSFDVAQNRATIAAIARKVDHTRPALYYRPCTEVSWPVFSVEAMWASLDSGVPTVDGYSGYAPPDWIGFLQIGSEIGKPVRETLSDWERARCLPQGSVQWIGEDCPEREGWTRPPRRPGSQGTRTTTEDGRPHGPSVATP